MNEVLQDSSKTGNSLKSISANMSGVIFGLKEGDVQANKTAKALESLTGIKLFDEQTGEVMDMYEAMSQLNDQWDTLTEAQKSSIAQTIAGKQNLQSFLALMDNWETAEEYVKAYNEGLTANSAYEENIQYLDSIQGKWNAIKENLAGIGNSLISSDMAKGFLDIGVALSNIANTDVGKAIAGITASFATLFATVSGFKALNKVLDFSGTFSSMKDGLKGMVVGVKDMAVGLGKLALAHPVLTAIVASVVAVGGAYAYFTTQKEKALKQGREDIANLKQEIQADEQRVASLRAVAEEYDNLYWKSNKTAEEQARYAELTNEIAQLYPELVTGYDVNGDPILALNGNAEQYCNTLDRAIQKKNELLASEEGEQADREREQLEDIYEQRDKHQFGVGTDLETNYQGEKKIVERSGEELQKLEEERYKQRLEAHERYCMARDAIDEDYHNKMESRSEYKGLDEADQDAVERFYDSMDFANLEQKQGKGKAESFVNDLDKVNNAIVDNTEITEENKKAWQDANAQYAETSNLNNLADSYVAYSEAIGGIDIDAFEQYRQAEEEYINRTGDVEGAMRAREKIIDSISEATGIDKDILRDALYIDPEPLTVADEKLKQFLNNYNTGLGNLGKGGLADKLQNEFSSLTSFREDLESAISSGETITPELLIEWSVDAPTPIKNLVDQAVKDGLTDEEIEIIRQASVEIENEGEISDELKAKIKELYPDMTDEEIEAMFTVKADVQNEQEIDEVLKKYDTLDLDVEARIRCAVENAEEAEALYQAIEKLPEEKRLEAVSNYDTVKEEARQLGVSLEQFDTETIVRIGTEIDTAQLDEFLQATEGMSNEEVNILLNTDGFAEAIAECETVEQMLQVIEEYKAKAEIDVENKGEDEIEKTSQQIDELDGKNAQAELMIETDTGTFEQDKQKLVEMDGKTYMSVWNFDTNSEELVEVTDQVENLPDQKTTNIDTNVTGKEDVTSLKDLIENAPDQKTTNYDANVTGKEDVEILGNAIEGTPDSKTSNIDANVSGKEDVNQLNEDVKNLPSDATVEVEAKVKQDSKGGILDTIKGWFGGGESVTQTVEIKGKVTDVEVPTNTNLTVEIKGKVTDIEMPTSTDASIDVQGKVSDIEMPTSTDASIDVKGKVSDIEMPTSTDASIDVQGKVSDIEMPTSTDATITIQANVSGADQINTLKNNISSMQNKTVSVTTSVTGGEQVNSLKTNIAGLQSKSVSVSASVNGTNLVQSLKTSITGLQGKSVSVTASVTGTNLVQSLKSAIDTVQAKTVSVTANVTGTSETKALTSAIDSVKSKSVSVKATVSGTSDVQSLASAIAQVQSKNVKVSASISKTVTETVVKKEVGGEATPSSISMNDTENTSSLANIPISASDTPTEDIPSLANATVSAKAVNRSSILSSVENGVDMYVELEQALDRIASQFDLIDKKAEHALGQEKIKLLQQQIPLLKQQQSIQQQIANEERNQLSVLKSQLQSKGFLIDANNELVNYEEKLLAMEKNVQSLNDAYERASKLASDTDSKNESLKKSREQDAENKKKAYDNANESLQLTKKYLDEFINSSKELADANNSWQEYENEITSIQKEVKELNDEIEKLNREKRLFASTNKLTQLDYEFEKIGNSLDMLDNKIDSATETDKINLLTQSIGLLNKQLDLQNQKISATKEQMKAYQVDLKKYGFAFNNNNELTNFESNMNRFKDSDDLEKMVELTEEYFDLQKELGSLTVDYDDLQKEMSDVKDEIKEINEELEKERLDGLKEQLETTKDIEEELTKVYEEEYDKRKEELEDYMDARIKLLEDEKDAYKEMRDQQEYEKGLQDQTDEVEELRKKLEVARRDNSIQGLKRQKELAEELAKAEEDLAEYTQDKIDEDYEKNIDAEIEKIEAERDALLGALEEQFSEVNIAKMVQSALTSGFVEINGELKSIQELLMESVNKTADAYSVMGATIKQELVDNLNVALSTMKELENIYSDLSLSNYGLISSNISSAMPVSNYSTNTRNITVGETNITINGSVSNDILDDIEELIEQKNNEMLKSISRDL